MRASSESVAAAANCSRATRAEPRMVPRGAGLADYVLQLCSGPACTPNEIASHSESRHLLNVKVHVPCTVLLDYKSRYNLLSRIYLNVNLQSRIGVSRIICIR
jgi:hypothetical protein